MASLSLLQVTCGVHVNDDAILFCKHHRELLCIICVTEKKHAEQDCQLVSIKEMKQQTDQDALVLECLQIRQAIKERKRQRDEFHKTYESIKDQLILKVKTEKEMLIDKIRSLAESSEKKIVDEITSRQRDLENETCQLDDFQSSFDELLKDLESKASINEANESKEEVNEISENLSKTLTRLFDEMKKQSSLRDRTTKPSGNFNILDSLSRISKLEDLGWLHLESDDLYASIDELDMNIDFKISDGKQPKEGDQNNEELKDKKQSNAKIEDVGTLEAESVDSDSLSNTTDERVEETAVERRKQKSRWNFFGKRKSNIPELTNDDKEQMVTESIKL